MLMQPKQNAYIQNSSKQQFNNDNNNHPQKLQQNFQTEQSKKPTNNWWVFSLNSTTEFKSILWNYKILTTEQKCQNNLSKKLKSIQAITNQNIFFLVSNFQGPIYQALLQNKKKHLKRILLKIKISRVCNDTSQQHNYNFQVQRVYRDSN
eukprot:TRINITY_DN12267_c0_g2_i1.p2 TRINITY_DN12267_c0_g2~~TRINITY_DN12267_c0_g2_i1.p2  ORF type:complete len:150 (+),score=7.58 TRINITY_DN12267_c0_g2_i1:261-710(+)